MTPQTIDRRTLLAICGGAVTAGTFAAGAPSPDSGGRNPLPRWRGVNLLEKFAAGRDGNRPNRPFLESDFDWLAQWRFDFVRLPLPNAWEKTVLETPFVRSRSIWPSPPLCFHVPRELLR